MKRYVKYSCSACGGSKCILKYKYDKLLCERIIVPTDCPCRCDDGANWVQVR